MSTREALQPSQLAVSKPPRKARTEPRRLIEALRAGDRSAAETLVDQTYELIYASLFRLCGDADLSADLTQETYARAWQSLGQFEGRCRFSTWLYRIAYTTFLNQVRRPQRLTPLDESGGQLLRDPGVDPETAFSERVEAQRLRRAVLRLPEDLRFTVTARFWGEVPVREIARTEGITTVAIRKRLRRAVQRLRSALEEEAS